MDIWYFKHVHANRISYWCVKGDGMFVNVTVTTRSISQQISRFDDDETEEDRKLWIEKMVDVGEEIEAEEWIIVQDWYARNGARMFNNEISYEELRKFINERNVKRKKTEDNVNMDGQFGMGIDW